jgi:hypothetical protein
MIYHGLASHRVNQALELFPTREEAQAALDVMLEVAPELAEDAFVTELEIEDPSSN